MESVLKRIAKNSGVLAAAAAEWPQTDRGLTVLIGDASYKNVVASSLDLLAECTDDEPMIQVTIGKTAVLAEQRGDRALVIVSELGHSIRKSLRRIMRQSFKRLGVQPPAALPPAAQPSPAAPVPHTVAPSTTKPPPAESPWTFEDGNG